MTMIDSEIQRLVGPQCTALADMLADQSAAITDSPSLCEGWTVKNVLAHLTMAVRYDQTTFMRELAAVDHRFDVLSDRIAERDGALPVADLLRDLRSETMANWAPPRGGAIGALSHVVIHGLDITSAVDLPRSADDDATRIVLDALAGGLAVNFGVDPAGPTWRATDLDWSFGSGPPLEAPAADLILLLAGRPRPLSDLEGPRNPPAGAADVRS